MALKILGTGSYLPPQVVTNDDLAIAYKRLCDLVDALSGRM